MLPTYIFKCSISCNGYPHVDRAPELTDWRQPHATHVGSGLGSWRAAEESACRNAGRRAHHTRVCARASAARGAALRDGGWRWRAEARAAPRAAQATRFEFDCAVERLCSVRVQDWLERLVPNVVENVVLRGGGQAA